MQKKCHWWNRWYHGMKRKDDIEINFPLLLMHEDTPVHRHNLLLEFFLFNDYWTCECSRIDRLQTIEEVTGEVTDERNVASTVQGSVNTLGSNYQR